MPQGLSEFIHHCSTHAVLVPFKKLPRVDAELIQNIVIWIDRVGVFEVSKAREVIFVALVCYERASVVSPLKNKLEGFGFAGR